VIYGHNVSSLTDIRCVNDCWGIDTGCCFGGRLSAYVETLGTPGVEILQVQAKKKYCSMER
jgi:hypothetical protein